MKLTDKVIRLLPIPPLGNQRYADSATPGFAAIVTAAAYKGFVFRYNLAGRRRQMSLGAFPTWSTIAARARAQELRRLVDRGIDPLAEHEPVKIDTMASVIAEFIARDQAPRNRHWREVERILVKELASWLERDIKSITRRDVLDVLDTITDRGAPIRANRTLAWVRRLFTWSIGRGIVEASPVVGVEAPGHEVARDRVLAPAELAAVWHASEALEPPFGRIIRLLILTGARRGEVASMRRQDLDLEQRLWVVPASMNKSGRLHEIPLSDLAMEAIATLPRGEGLVFPANRAGSSSPVSGFSKIKARLDQLSGIAGWRLHDLRRTAATGMARLGHPPHVVAAVLNHAPASTMGITSIYNRFRYDDEKRAALDAWSREVERIIGRAEARVVKLHRTS